jgi:hypothetical protein
MMAKKEKTENVLIDADNIQSLITSFGPQLVVEMMSDQAKKSFAEREKQIRAECTEEVRAARRDQKKRDGAWSILFNTIAVILIMGATISLICGLNMWSSYLGRIGEAAYNRRLAVCASGDTIGCIHACQEEDDINNQPNVNLFKLAYKQKTNHDLPNP